jgi:hypothetical protein
MMNGWYDTNIVERSETVVIYHHHCITSTSGLEDVNACIYCILLISSNGTKWSEAVIVSIDNSRGVPRPSF